MKWKMKRKELMKTARGEEGSVLGPGRGGGEGVGRRGGG